MSRYKNKKYDIVDGENWTNIPENVIGEIKERRAKYYFPDFVVKPDCNLHLTTCC